MLWPAGYTAANWEAGHMPWVETYTDSISVQYHTIQHTRPHHYAIWCSYVCHCKLRFLWTDLEFNNGDIYGQKTWCQLTSSFETLGTSFIIVTEFTTVSNFWSDSSQYPRTYICLHFLDYYDSEYWRRRAWLWIALQILNWLQPSSWQALLWRWK